LSAAEIDDVDSERKEEIDDLLERARRSGDAEAILDLLVRLPSAEFEGLELGTSVPKALDFGERALNRRALGLALQQLGEARRRRGARSDAR
jgi:hypothetical protein